MASMRDPHDPPDSKRFYLVYIGHYHVDLGETLQVVPVLLI